MRYKFRGKRLDGQGWVYGDLIQVPSKNFASIMGQKPCDVNHEVLPETVGQWTGIKNVYEGDITKSVDSNWGYGGEYDRTHDGYLYQVVEFRDGAFYIGDNLLADCSDYEIVGNLIDSPELMEVE